MVAFHSQRTNLKNLVIMRFFPAILIMLAAPGAFNNYSGSEWDSVYSVILGLSLILIIYLEYRFPGKYTYFEVDDKYLYIHINRKHTNQYPLSNFGNEIALGQKFFSNYIIAPDYERHKGMIPLDFVDRVCQNRLIAYLEEKVASQSPK